MISTLVNNSHNAVLVGGVGIAGVTATSEAVIPDTTLSTILQIIIAVSTLVKLWADYRREERKGKK